MKNILLTFAGLFMTAKVIAQEPDSITVGQFKLNFISPDLPAFKALGTDPSNILRPSDVKEFAVSFNPFYNNNTLSIPKAFAAEVAPWRIASKNWYFGDYLNKDSRAFLYRTSFSVGTLRNDEQGNASKVSVGFRTSLVSKYNDITRNPELVNKIFERNAAILKVYTDELDIWLKTNKVRRVDYAAKNAQGDSLRQAFRKHYNGFIANSDDEISSYFDDFQKNKWNAPRFDFALAWLGNSADSLIKNAYFNSLQLWATQSLKVKSNGQLLLGANARFDRLNLETNKANNSISVSLRYYYGGADFRGFAETQRKFESSQSNSFLLNLGGEFRVQKSFWILFSTSVRNPDDDNLKSQLITNLEVRYNINR